MGQPRVSFFSKDTECYGGPSLPSRFGASENISRIEGIVAGYCTILSLPHPTVCYDGKTLYIESQDGRRRSKEVDRNSLEAMAMIELCNCIIALIKELKVIDEPLYP